MCLEIDRRLILYKILSLNEEWGGSGKGILPVVAEICKQRGLIKILGIM